MGEYATYHASDIFNQELNHFENIEDSYKNNPPKDSAPLDYIPYIDIKKKTEKAVLIKLDIQISPFRDTKYFDIDYVWLPLKWIRLSEETKQVAITLWLLERKLEEQCGIIAEREYK